MRINLCVCFISRSKNKRERKRENTVLSNKTKVLENQSYYKNVIIFTICKKTQIIHSL